MSCEDQIQLEAYRGNEVPYTVVITNETTGLPVDITGDTVILTVKAALTGDALITKINTVHSSPTTGTTEFVLESADTLALPPRNYYLDVTWINGAAVTTLFVARLQILTPVRTPT